MDTSEQYIKMCEKAEEIQELYSPQDGDWFETAGCIYVRTDLDIMTNRAHLNELFTWLPRQDQLQEMIGTKNVWFLLNELGDFMGRNLIDWDSVSADTLHTPPPKTEWLTPSIEQLWLAFVMKGKFNKIWSCGDWHNSTEHQLAPQGGEE